MESLITAFTEARTSYQILAVAAAVAIIVYALSSRGNSADFPRWAIIEIAVVGMVLPSRGKGRQF